MPGQGIINSRKMRIDLIPLPFLTKNCISYYVRGIGRGFIIGQTAGFSTLSIKEVQHLGAGLSFKDHLSSGSLLLRRPILKKGSVV
jgi:hypothetical protein